MGFSGFFEGLKNEISFWGVGLVCASFQVSLKGSYQALKGPSWGFGGRRLLWGSGDSQKGYYEAYHKAHFKGCYAFGLGALGPSGLLLGAPRMGSF